jgi:hypothetical protein
VKIPRTLFRFLKDEPVWAVYLGYDDLTSGMTLEAAVNLRNEYAKNSGLIFLQVEHPEELLNEQAKRREGE